ncbi:hypothetical protein HanPSC8_Chr16g0746551 [Helianthus annuus]|nr:hypothetical protein HanPSC8_Chr16g0746551 [Helianthus annuus]
MIIHQYKEINIPFKRQSFVLKPDSVYSRRKCITEEWLDFTSAGEGGGRVVTSES